MRIRILTALILIPIAVFIIFAGIGNGLPMVLVSILVGIVICYEIFTMLEKQGYRFYIWIISGMVTLSNVSFYLLGLGIYDYGYLFVVQTALLTVLCLTIMTIESMSGTFQSSMENIGISLFAYIILGIFAPMVILIKMMDLSGWLLTILFSITWLTDTGGLVFGKIWGKNRIKMLSSPNKTVEGYIGAVLFGLVTGLILYSIQKIFALSTNFTLLQMLLISLFIIAGSIIGDLGESTMKRWAGAKDSGDTLPGHGGFFDRFDSLIFSTPVFFCILKLLGY